MICTLHQRDLAESGVNLDWAEAAGLRCAPQVEVKEILGFDPHCGGLVIEYPGTNGTKASFIRVKPDRPFLDRYGKPSKYLSPKGAGNRLYIPPGVEAVLSDHKTPLWITEGEKSTEGRPGRLALHRHSWRLVLAPAQQFEPQRPDSRP
jgi:hypothetical protein